MEGVRPVTPDMEAIEAISRGIEERAQIVCGTQIELLEAQQNQDVLDEQEFYAEVRLLFQVKIVGLMRDYKITNFSHGCRGNGCIYIYPIESLPNFY